MKVAQIGSGDPEIAVLAGVHGDEPCGVRAIERLLEEQPSVERPIKLVVANEKALERRVRFVDEDLNRVFPGDSDTETHERQLAHRLLEELEGCLTFSMHSTQSYADPFAIVDGVDETAREVCPQLPVSAMVDTSNFAEGRLITELPTIEVECGQQGTETAAQNANRLIRAFLTSVGALPGDTVTRDLPVYQLTDVVPKEPADTYEVFVENFTQVEAGVTFAAADGNEQVADESFYPVLMSPNGYRDVFGYAAEKLEVLESPPAAD
ncbi:M14 family metallopeptidase [Halobiforma nitratireducens]|uniref:Succinylglutamate desuccinylase/aspartoacylase n=1 Tax=Halobiforma nitratireducens JCM 10879 TaxID=1227454 RepID=M0MIM9_9EURY|nr:succinylglutamate desuccinylase/aspartoacylase family protein [Halobiforma nitratireducens]EMA45547.1 succinylglutamate desuccinylase/aspartoacylase [Halobiforma nitratireducens JCM 10879]